MNNIEILCENRKSLPKLISGIYSLDRIQESYLFNPNTKETSPSSHVVEYEIINKGQASEIFRLSFFWTKSNRTFCYIDFNNYECIKVYSDLLSSSQLIRFSFGITDIYKALLKNIKDQYKSF